MPHRPIVYYCRLCREHCKLPKQHLRYNHKADAKALSNKSFDDIVDVVFLEAMMIKV